MTHAICQPLNGGYAGKLLELDGALGAHSYTSMQNIVYALLAYAQPRR